MKLDRDHKILAVLVILGVATVLLMGCTTTKAPEPINKSFPNTRIKVFEDSGQYIEAIPICDAKVVCYYMNSAGISVGLSCVDLADRYTLMEKYCQ
jgi:hypothetical protein